MSIWFYISIVLSVLSVWMFTRRANTGLRIPVMVMLVAYGITTVVGSTAIGMLHNNLVWKAVLDPSLNTSVIINTDGFRYWVLLYMPFVIVPGVLAFVRSGAQPGPIVDRAIALFETDIDLISYSAALAIFVGYCVAALVRAGYAGNLLRAAAMSGDLVTLIQLRTEMFSALGGPTYSIIYIAIPTLCNIALYQYLKGKGKMWLFLLATGVAADILLVLSTIQKGAVMVLLLGLVLGVITLRKVRLILLGIWALVGLAVLTLMQAVLMGKLDVLMSILLVFHRMAECYPFYVNVYPRLEHFQGMDYIYRVIGMRAGPDDNVTIFNYMFPGTYFVQGNATAAAHVRGYSQGGMPAAIIYLLIIAAAIVLIAKLRHSIRGPLTFSLYIQGLIFLYFVTQTNLGEALKGYGILYAVIALAVVWTCRQIVLLATQPVQAAAQALSGGARKSPR